MRCLPYIYLVGVTKSGTSDLFENIIKHPNIVPGAIKEPMWWNRHRIGNTHTHTHTHTHAYIYIYIYIYTRAHAHTHTHTHTI